MMTLEAQCVICKSQFKTSSRLRRHFLKSHGDLEVEGLKCYFCEYISPDKLCFKEHKEKFHVDKKFVCKKCDFKTRKWTRMERHFDKHKAASIENLPSSEHLTSSVMHLEFDEFTDEMQNNTDQILGGDNSSVGSENLLKIDAHFINGTSLAEKPSVPSNVINDGWIRFDCLDNRVCPALKGPETKRLHCEVCYKTFRHRGHLNVHMRIHTGEKPYTCSLCDYSARHGSTIDRHMKSHFNDRRYACDACDYKSVYKSTLQRHYRTHTGVKPFICEFCPKAFTQRGLLNNHRRRHHFCEYSKQCSP